MTMIKDIQNPTGNLQNATMLDYVGTGGQKTYVGQATGTYYQAGGNIKKLFVDNRDVEFLLTLKRNYRPVFKVSQQQPKQVVKTQKQTLPPPVDINEEIEFFNSMGEEVPVENTETMTSSPEPDDFTKLTGIGKATQQAIYDKQVFTYLELYNRGVEFLEQLPYITLETSEKVYKQLEEKLG